MRTVSLAPLTVLPCSPLEQIDIAAEVGFNAVSLRLFPVLKTDVDVMADHRLQSAIRRRIEAAQLNVLDVEVVRAAERLDVRALAPALEFAGSIGAHRLAITGAAGGACDAPAEAAVVGRIAELCDAAERCGMGVMLEFISYLSIRTLEDAAKIVAAVGHPGLGITVDTLHLFRSGGTVEDLLAVPSERLACLQLSDAPAAPPADLVRESFYDRKFPGEGDLPLVAILNALPPDIPVSVEVPSSEHASLSPYKRASKAMASLQSLHVL
ncbi:MAG: sugar phosphate isomerase/epimerase [Hyphomicrobiales bacterium]|nr:MAG: sugar phosphate isomerase/epimerase [Hyphomicrobiales bacterium]